MRHSMHLALILAASSAVMTLSSCSTQTGSKEIAQAAAGVNNAAPLSYDNNIVLERADYVDGVTTLYIDYLDGITDMSVSRVAWGGSYAMLKNFTVSPEILGLLKAIAKEGTGVQIRYSSHPSGQSTNVSLPPEAIDAIVSYAG